MANKGSSKKGTKLSNKRSKSVVSKKSDVSYTKFISVSLIVLSILVVSLSVAFGFFSYSRSGNTQNVVYTANLNIVVNDENSIGINATNAFPMYDEVGHRTDPYNFSLENSGSVAANYVMRLVPDLKAISSDLCEDNLLSDSSIKFQLIKDGIVVNEGFLSDLDDYIVDSGFIGLTSSVNSYSYQLRMWIASSAGKEVMGRHYHGKIQVDIVDPNKS